VSVQVDIIKHMEVEHGLRGQSMPVVCLATLVEKTSHGFVHCPAHLSMSNRLRQYCDSRDKKGREY